jgi:hypothetical protein
VSGSAERTLLVVFIFYPSTLQIVSLKMLISKNTEFQLMLNILLTGGKFLVCVLEGTLYLVIHFSGPIPTGSKYLFLLLKTPLHDCFVFSHVVLTDGKSMFFPSVLYVPHYLFHVVRL